MHRPTCPTCSTQAVLRRTQAGQIQWRCVECDKVLGDKLFLDGVKVAEYLAKFGKSITDIPTDLPSVGECVICGVQESRTFSWFPPDAKCVVYLCDQHQQAFQAYWIKELPVPHSDDTSKLIEFAVDTMGARIAA